MLFISSLACGNSPAAYVKNELFRAFCDTSMKIGPHMEWTMAIVLRNRAIADLTPGCHGNHFWVKTDDLYKYHCIIRCIVLMCSKLLSMERARNFG